jgi:hypothetical protein
MPTVKRTVPPHAAEVLLERLAESELGKQVLEQDRADQRRTRRRLLADLERLAAEEHERLHELRRLRSEAAASLKEARAAAEVAARQYGQADAACEVAALDFSQRRDRGLARLRATADPRIDELLERLRQAQHQAQQEFTIRHEPKRLVNGATALLPHTNAKDVEARLMVLHQAAARAEELKLTDLDEGALTRTLAAIASAAGLKEE